YTITSTTPLPSTSVTFTFLSFNPSSSNTSLVNIPTTASTYLSTVKLSHRNNNDVVGINDVIDINEDKSCNLDDNKELGTIVSWPIIVGEIE
ncbi:unnamed protein product, partial [Rotaria sp. Silwood1]